MRTSYVNLPLHLKPGTANKPHGVVFPHGKKNKETGKVEPCDPIEKVSYKRMGLL